MGYCGQKISFHDSSPPPHFTFQSPFPGSEAGEARSAMDIMDDGFITATDGYYRGAERERKTDRLVKTKVSSCLGFN